MKRITFVTSSLKGQSTSRRFMEEAIKGIDEEKFEVKRLDLRDVDLEFCRGCLACQETGKCVIKDGVSSIIETVENSDILVFVSPIYYYSITGQLKTFLDRMNPLYISTKRMFTTVYGLFTCADTEMSAFQGAVTAIQNWVDCFEGVTLKGALGIHSQTAVSDIAPEDLKKAYEFGLAISGLSLISDFEEEMKKA